MRVVLLDGFQDRDLPSTVLGFLSGLLANPASPVTVFAEGQDGLVRIVPGSPMELSQVLSARPGQSRGLSWLSSEISSDLSARGRDAVHVSVVTDGTGDPSGLRDASRLAEGGFSVFVLGESGADRSAENFKEEASRVGQVFESTPMGFIPFVRKCL